MSVDCSPHKITVKPRQSQEIFLSTPLKIFLTYCLLRCTIILPVDNSSRRLPMPKTYTVKANRKPAERDRQQ